MDTSQPQHTYALDISNRSCGITTADIIGWITQVAGRADQSNSFRIEIVEPSSKEIIGVYPITAAAE
jgi:hypothetical protein